MKGGQAAGGDPAGHSAEIARALVEAFGDRALAIARRQQDLADGDAATTWTTIVALLNPGS